MRSLLYRWVWSLAIAAPMLSVAALSVTAAEINVTDEPTHVWGGPHLAVNPKNPNNIVLTAIGNGMTKSCAATATDPRSPCAPFRLANGPSFGGTQAPPVGMITDVPGFVMVAAWASFDGGKTWKETAQVKQGGSVPVFPPDKYQGPAEADTDGLAVTNSGTFYMAWDAVCFSDVPLYATFGAIPVTHSSDGGRTWSTPIRTGSSPDGGQLLYDPAMGVLYTFSSGRPGPGPMTLGDPNVRISKDNPHHGMSRHFLISTDGMHWSEPHITGGGGGGMAVSHGLLATAFKTTAGTAPNATALRGTNGLPTGTQNYLASGRSPPNDELCGDAPKPCTIFETTEDGGVTWTRHVASVPNDYGGQPLMAAAPLKMGYFTMAFTTNHAAELDLYRTEDAGQTWNGPTKIAAEPGKVFANTELIYGSNGDLGIAWRSRNAPPAGAQGGGPGGGGGGGFGQNRGPSDIFAVLSRDGGATFSQPVKINSEELVASASDMTADACAVCVKSRQFALSRDGGVAMVLTPEEAYFAWPDWRTGEGAIFFKAVKFSAFKP